MNKSIPHLHTEIMSYAVKIAEQIVSEQLDLLPFCIAMCKRGMLCHHQPTHTDDDKDLFLAVCRLMAESYRAKCAILIADTWLSLKTDMSVAPSADPDRRSAISVYVQTPWGAAVKLFASVPDADGKTKLVPFFATVGMPEMDEDGVTAGGRFADIIPTKRPNRARREMARRALDSIGFKPFFARADAPGGSESDGGGEVTAKSGAKGLRITDIPSPDDRAAGF